MEKFTGLQLKCLLLWVNLPERSRTITAVAMKMNASRTAARKALNAAVDQGLLDKEYQLTKEGSERIKAYKHQHQMLLNWMKLHHIDEAEWDDVYTLMTEMGPAFQRAMVEESLLCSICRGAAENGSYCFQGIDLADYLAEGKYEVQVEFRKAEKEDTLSMANRAFERPAYLIVEKEKSEIVLKRLKIIQFSPEKHQEVGGMMRSMEYSIDGKIKTIRAEEEVVKVPTKDIAWDCSEKNRQLTGRLEMGFTCTAGFHNRGNNRAVMCVNVIDGREKKSVH